MIVARCGADKTRIICIGQASLDWKQEAHVRFTVKEGTAKGVRCYSVVIGEHDLKRALEGLGYSCYKDS